MKRLFLFLMIGTLALLVACSPKEATLRLDKPINLAVNKNVLTFNAVENADHYIINANSVNFEVFDTTHTFLEEGTYSVRIRAVGQGYLDSLFSDEVTVVVGYLNYPTGVAIIEEQITYNLVPNATSYNIEINGEVYNTSEDELPDFTPGTYIIRIQALSNVYIDSPYSPAEEFMVGYLNYPEVISIVNNQLVFLPVPNASAYNIEINGEVYNTSETIIPYFLPGTYFIRIQALSDYYVDSPYSPIVEFEIDENTRLTTTHSYSYSRYSTFDLPLFTYISKSVNTFEFELVTIDDKGTETTADDEEVFTVIEPVNLYILENTVYVYAEYLESLYASGGSTETRFVFQLTTNLGDHRIVLNVTDDQKPYMYTDKNVTTNFHDDIVFRFDEFGANFIGVYGPQFAEITPDDYTYEDGVLTIHIEYIVRIFSNDFNRNHIFLTYRFDSGTFTYFGLFSIRK